MIDNIAGPTRAGDFFATVMQVYFVAIYFPNRQKRYTKDFLSALSAFVGYFTLNLILPKKERNASQQKYHVSCDWPKKNGPSVETERPFTIACI